MGFVIVRGDKQREDFEEYKLDLIFSCLVELGSMFKELDFNIQEFSRWELSMGLEGGV